jgi:hypothetical protein
MQFGLQGKKMVRTIPLVLSILCLLGYKKIFSMKFRLIASNRPISLREMVDIIIGKEVEMTTQKEAMDEIVI